MKGLFRVLKKTDAVTLTKQDGTQTQKATLIVQVIGGRYEDTFAAVMLGNDAAFGFDPGEIVCASLRFTARESIQGQGQYFQDVLLQDVVKLQTVNY